MIPQKKFQRMLRDAGVVGAGLQPLVKSNTVILTDAQIKTLPTVGVQLVPAPGVGQISKLSYALLRLHLVEPYEDLNLVARIGISYAYPSQGQASTLSLCGDTLFFDYGPDADLVGFLHAFLYYQEEKIEDQAAWQQSEVENQPLMLSVGNLGANFTAGHADNQLAITTFYVTLPLV